MAGVRSEIIKSHIIKEKAGSDGLICTPFPGQPGKGVLLCAIHTSLNENVLNCIGMVSGLKLQKMLNKGT
ncbi:MAG: hypothetical protein IJ930_10315, partial [Lachnospiraceae bacterium]|nr:hypothetical protein [Lachnospiraceae bacterium]